MMCLVTCRTEDCAALFSNSDTNTFSRNSAAMDRCVCCVREVIRAVIYSTRKEVRGVACEVIA